MSPLKSDDLLVVARQGAQAGRYKVTADELYQFIRSEMAAIVNPPGTVIHIAGDTPPAGWVKANGALLDRTAYANLFAVIGTRYGVGDGSTTFAIPDLRGQFIRSLDDGRGFDANRSLGSFQPSQNLWHGHGISDPGHGHGVYDAGHSHGVYDPGHEHGYHRSDPGGAGAVNLGSTYFCLTNLHQPFVGTDHRGTGIALHGSGTGISLYGSGTNISLQGEGGSESRPINTALLALIKY